MVLRNVFMIFLMCGLLISSLQLASAKDLLPTERTGKDGATMVLIPAGLFPMGVPPGRPRRGAGRISPP